MHEANEIFVRRIATNTLQCVALANKFGNFTGPESVGVTDTKTFEQSKNWLMLSRMMRDVEDEKSGATPLDFLMRCAVILCTLQIYKRKGIYSLEFGKCSSLNMANFVEYTGCEPAGFIVKYAAKYTELRSFP